MSYRSETFLALQCDYPDCGTLYDDGEFTYWADGPDTSYAEENGWIVQTDQETTAYCPEHVRTVPCPPETMRTDDEGVPFCEWCEDHASDAHLAPYTTSVADQLEIAMKRITEDAERAAERLLFRVDRELGTGHMGGPGTLRGRTDQALNDIHRRACLAIRPDLTSREIHLMQETAQ